MATTNYIIKVQTSDRLAAGTDANIFVQLFGDEGISQTFELKKSDKPNKFERDQMDEFKFLSVRLIGRLERLKVWHDNKGTMPSWHLEFIEVSDTRLGTTFRFPCHKWIGGKYKCEIVLKCMEVFNGPKFVSQMAIGIPNPNPPIRKTSFGDQIVEIISRKFSD